MSESRRRIIEQIVTAKEIVDAAGLPDDLRVAAFQHALDASAAAASGAPTRTLPLLRTPAADADLGLALIATTLRLSDDVVERIYEQDNGTVRLALPSSLLPQPHNKAASMRHVALLVAVGRQVGSGEDATPFSVIRRECDELQVLDGPNFATEVGKLKMRLVGTRNTRAVRTQPPHLRQAAALIQRMVRPAEVPR